MWNFRTRSRIVAAISRTHQNGADNTGARGSYTSIGRRRAAGDIRTHWGAVTTRGGRGANLGCGTRDASLLARISRLVRDLLLEEDSLRSRGKPARHQPTILPLSRAMPLCSLAASPSARDYASECSARGKLDAAIPPRVCFTRWTRTPLVGSWRTIGLARSEPCFY